MTYEFSSDLEKLIDDAQERLRPGSREAPFECNLFNISQQEASGYHVFALNIVYLGDGLKSGKNGCNLYAMITISAIALMYAACDISIRITRAPNKLWYDGARESMFLSEGILTKIV